MNILENVVQKTWSILNNLDDRYVFQGIFHTKRIIEIVDFICEEQGIEKEEIEIIQIAAHFLQTGLSVRNEEFYFESINIAKEFLKEHNYPSEKVEMIVNCINVGNGKKIPSKLEEEVISDAVNEYLGSADYKEIKLMIRKEFENFYGVQSDKNWTEKLLYKIDHTKYYTSYGERKFESKRGENQKSENKKLKKFAKTESLILEKDLEIDESSLKDLKKKLSKIQDRPERGIETMFRLASKNQLTQSGLLDNKANMIISINAIILSVILGTVLKELSTDPHLIYPIVIMFIGNLVSITFAVLATKPPSTSGIITKKDIEAKNANLISFRHFFKMKEKDYKEAMQVMMNDADFLYGTITKDVFYTGKLLGERQRYLSKSYMVFLIGVIVAVIAFLVCHILFANLYTKL